MKISKINEYSYSYAEYLITDGKREIRCVCNSVPLPYNLEPVTGMHVRMLYAFNYGLVEIKKENNFCDDSIEKTEKHGFQYEVVGSILDRKKSLIKVFDFVISLEYAYPNGIDKFEDGDKILLVIDRIECELDV